MKVNLPLAMLMLLAGGSTWAVPTPGGPTSSQSSTTQPAAPAGQTSSGQSLFEQTLPLDIDTAGYYELLAWVRRLGLSDAGTRTDLQARLRTYYHLPPSAAAAPSQQKKARTITIVSAGTTEYFKLEKVGEKYIRLSGGVDLEMYDPATDTTHSIIADTVVFNETQKTITAIGHITYTLTGKGKTEIFHGKSLTFNIDSWAGIFFQGVSESKKTVNGNPLTFYYTGQTIKRTKNDVVTLDNGTITSSQATPPNYQIKARKIWVLAPGEWALRGATLYLGRIPVFYFPYFFYPGNNLFFHPSMGYRQEEGYYLQTTTYLLGRRQKQNSSLSFLQTAEDTNVIYNTKLRGLFLDKTTPVTAAEESKTPYDFQNSYVRLLLDIYSRLGVFAGIESKFVDYGIVKNFKFNLEFARSRDIFLVGSDYTQFLPLFDGSTTVLWNSANLGPILLPVRYGTDLETQLGNKLFSITAAIPFYSDPYFSRDFGQRNQSVDWSKILGLSGSSTTSTTSATTYAATLPTPLTSLQWTIHSTFTPNTSKLAPFVTDFELTNLDASVLWQTQTRASIPGVALSTYNPTTVTGSAVGYKSDFTFPEQQFFYPQSIIFPSIAAKISGTIFSTSPTIPGASSTAAPNTPTPEVAPASPPAETSGSAPAAPSSTAQGSSPGAANPTAASPSPASGGTTPAASTTTPSSAAPAATAQGGGAASPSASAGGSTSGTSATSAPPKTAGAGPQPHIGEVSPPWKGAAPAAPSPPAAGTLRPEPALPDVPITTPPTITPYSQSLTYSIVPSLSLENRPVATAWTSPADINPFNAYSIFTSIGTGTLTYSGALDNTLLDFQNSLALSGSYKRHFNQNYSISDWQSFLLQDYGTTFLNLTNSLNVQSQPFQANDVLTGSSVNYSIAGLVFSRNWVSATSPPVYQDSFLSWDQQHITTNSLNLNLDVTPYQTTSSLSVAATLPPLNPKVASTLQTGPLTSIVTAAWTVPPYGGPYTPQPLSIEEILTPVSWLTFDTKAIYVYESNGVSENAWDTATTSVTATSANKLFSAQQSFTYDLYYNYPQDSLTSLRLWFLTASFEAQYTYPEQFILPTGWIQEPNQEFMPSTLSFGVDYQYTSRPLWKNRINFSTHIQSAWNMNLIQVTSNSLTLNLTASLSIYKFLDLSFSLQSADRATYLYFPSYAAEVNQEPINPIVDFLQSINIFSRAQRQASNFKMQSVDLKLVHHLGDWDLSLEYTGTPQLTTAASGLSSYQWTPTFTIAVTWDPVPEIKSNLQVANGQLSY